MVTTVSHENDDPVEMDLVTGDDRGVAGR